MRRLRIVQALHGWPPASMGGTGLYVEALARALRRAGHDVVLLAPRGRPGLVEGVEDGLRYCRAGGLPALRWRHTWAPPTLGATLARWLQQRRPDVVHVHHLSGLTTDLPALASAAGARVVMTLHDYHLVCPRGQLVDVALRPCAGPARGDCPGCASGQAPAAARAPGPAAQASPRAAAGIAAARRADVLLAPSHDLIERAVRLGLPRPTHCPLPLVRPIAAAPRAPDGPLRFLFLGSLLPTKGPLRLVDAFARLPHGAATLTLVGPAPPQPGHPDYGARVQARVARTPGARWTGAVPAEAVDALLHEHDVLVLPSVWPENSPLVVREATAAGLRVLVGASGGAPELAPAAPTIPTDLDVDGFTALLRAEVARGRARQRPMAWPDPDTHAAWLVRHHYGPPSPSPTR